MAAYLVGHMTVNDPELWKQYVAGVARSLEPFRAQLVFRGQRAAVLGGAHDHDRAVVIRFDDQEQLQGWFRSPAYQALIPLRDRAADVVLVSYDEVG
jgi:uncharacterized protein (DUF1330 family)